MSPPSAVDVLAATDTQALTFSDHFSVNGVSARRAKAAAISDGVAAHATSDMFKSPVGFCMSNGFHLGDLMRYQDDGKPAAKRWDRRLPCSVIHGYVNVTLMDRMRV